MIIVSGKPFDISTILDHYSEDSVQRQVLNKMSSNGQKYEYDTLSQLEFKLDLRNEAINAAVALNNSDLSFAGFHDSKCNPDYWERTDNGGFLLVEGVSPGDAITDIFINGGEYATECATAIQIVYYKALLSVYGETLFNEQFPNIYLMNWDIREPLLEELGIPRKVSDILIGDRGYFINPDVNPKTPEWQGENVIVLPDSLYYGHGIGIGTADEIIKALNANRKDGATRPAYLLDSVSRPDFKKLSDILQDSDTQPAPLVWKPFPKPITPV